MSSPGGLCRKCRREGDADAGSRLGVVAAPDEPASRSESHQTLPMCRGEEVGRDTLGRWRGVFEPGWGWDTSVLKGRKISQKTRINTGLPGAPGVVPVKGSGDRVGKMRKPGISIPQGNNMTRLWPYM